MQVSVVARHRRPKHVSPEMQQQDVNCAVKADIVGERKDGVKLSLSIAFGLSTVECAEPALFDYEASPYEAVRECLRTAVRERQLTMETKQPSAPRNFLKGITILPY